MRRGWTWLWIACCALPAIGRAQTAEAAIDRSREIVLHIDRSDPSTRSMTLTLVPAGEQHAEPLASSTTSSSTRSSDDGLETTGWALFAAGALLHPLVSLLVGLTDAWLGNQMGYALSCLLPGAGPFIQLAIGLNTPPGHEYSVGLPITAGLVGGMELAGLLFALVGAASPTPPPAPTTPEASDEHDEPTAQTPAPSVNVVPNGGPAGGALTLRVQW